MLRTDSNLDLSLASQCLFIHNTKVNPTLSQLNSIPRLVFHFFLSPNQDYSLSAGPLSLIPSGRQASALRPVN